MIRFCSVSVFGSSLVKSDLPCDVSEVPSCENYLVDDSHFAPMSEVVKRLSSSGIQSFSTDEQKMLFDFPDGKVPSGFKVPFVRGPNYKDIAELSQYIQSVQSSASDSLKADIQAAKDSAKLDSLKSVVKSSKSSGD